jgi:hypothetical protein
MLAAAGYGAFWLITSIREFERTSPPPLSEMEQEQRWHTRNAVRLDVRLKRWRVISGKQVLCKDPWIEGSEETITCPAGDFDSLIFHPEKH